MKPCLPIAHTLCPTPLGDLRLAATARGLAGAWFVQGQRDTPDAATVGCWPQPASTPENTHPVLALAARQLNEYFNRQRHTFDLPLDLSTGTAFQQSVWQALCGIETGQSQSYGAVAAHLGRPTAVRAVGSAVGANPLSIIVPCHRVLGSNGALTGYAGGLARKIALLRLEGWHISEPASPQTARALRAQRF